MKAVTFHAAGGPEVLAFEEIAAPAPGPGEVLVQVKACALNHLDLIVRARGPAAGLPFPHITGCDAAGVVAALGPGVSGISVGTAVVVNPALSCGICRFCRAGQQSLCEKFGILGRDSRGAMAEFVALPAANIHPTSGPLSEIEWAASPLVFMTAWRMLVTKALVRPGDRVLVMGAGGGVATAAIQIAKYAGAHVYATTSGQQKVQHALAAGADWAVDYRTSDVLAEVLALTDSDGVEIVVDSVGAATWQTSLACLGKGGRLVTCGATSSPTTSLDIRHMWRKQISLHGSTLASDREFKSVVGLLAGGRLRPVIDRVYPLQQAPDAEAYLESASQFGKVVLQV